MVQTRQVQRTNWHDAAGTVEDRFDDLLVPASASLPERSVRRLEPWDLEHLVPFREDYLAGFRAERYQVDLEEGFAKATDLMTAPIRVSIRRDIGGDEQRINSVRTSYHDVTFKHLLLPVWITAYRYRDRAYRILINARTGEVQGERPWSVGKIVLAVLGGIAVVAVVVMTVIAIAS